MGRREIVRLRWVLIAKAIAGLTLLAGLAVAAHLKRTGILIEDLTTELRQNPEPRFEWRSVDGKHWQAIAGGDSEPAVVTDAREGNSAGCPTGMVRVRGNYRLELNGEATGEIERIQDAACTDWISRDFPQRCRSFDRGKIADEVAKLPTRRLDYCIDRFEYPNMNGENPMIVVTFHEAEALCKKASKRLCNEQEWTFACEGEDVLPYPYGTTRDTTACVVDRTWRPFTEGALVPRDGPGARAELDRLWQAEPSGSRAGCKSPFGVYDMTGNVDEWTRSVRTTGYASVLKGGYWGPVRARCRPATRAHNEDFIAYQQSFRCCAESEASIVPPERTPTGKETKSLSAADGGTRVAASPTAADSPLPVESRALEQENAGDELAALARTRWRLTCTSSTVGARDRSSAPVLTLLLCVAAFVGRPRRR